VVLAVAAAGIVVVGYLFARTLGSAVQGLALADRNYARVNAIRIFVNILVAIVVLLGLSSLLGASFSSLVFGSTFIVIVLGLASQTVLANVFAGITIVLSAPFRTGDHISLVSSSYGAIGPSYPHELEYPTYTGRVRDIGLLYTVLSLDTGQVARIPNNIVVQALVINLTQTPRHAQRVRFTLSTSVRLEDVEVALQEVLRGTGPATPVGAPSPAIQVADVGAQTWDAAVVIWTEDPREEVVRDRILRALLPRLQAQSAAPASTP
jgi:small-conductance mechanosensitive channel